MKFSDRRIYHHSLKTSYAKDSNEELLNRFKTENWPKDTSQRLEIIQELENRRAKEQNRPACKIAQERTRLGSYYKGPKTRQFGEAKDFKEERNIIRVNITDREIGNVNNSYEMLDSYFHESRHAQQTFCKGELNPDTHAMCGVEIPDNGTKYYNYNYEGRTYLGERVELENSKVLNDNNHYDMLTSEMDSNTYACENMIKLKDMYKDDPKYAEYLDRRLSHFKNTNELNNTHKYSRALRQHDMLDNAIEREHISKKDAINARKMIDTRVLENEGEPVVQDSIDCENRIKETLKELNYKSNVNSDINTVSVYKDYRLNNIPKSDLDGINQYKTRNISNESESIKQIKFEGQRQDISTRGHGDETFFKDIEEKSQAVGIKEDAEFFSKQQTLQEGETIKEDRSFFEKVENKIGEFADKVEQKAETVAETVAEVMPGIKGQKQ